MSEEIIADEPGLVRLRMTQRLWSIFERHRLSFGARTAAQLPVVELLKSAEIEQYADYTNGNVLSTIGAFSYQRANPLSVAMGRYCSIADQTSVMGERHPIEYVTTSFFPLRTPRPSYRWARDDLLEGSAQTYKLPQRPREAPVLEHDVWTGNHVILARGITLHTGCVVAAGAVVTKDVPPYAIMGGNPARVIRLRFPERVVERLLASRWWDCHPRVLFTCDITEPERFLAALDQARATLPPFQPKRLNWSSLQPLLAD